MSDEDGMGHVQAKLLFVSKVSRSGDIIKLVGKLREAGIKARVGHIPNMGICVAYLGSNQMEGKQLKDVFYEELSKTTDFVTYSEE